MSTTTSVSFLQHIQTELDSIREAGLFKRERIITNAQGALNTIGSGNAEDAAFTTIYQTMIDIGNAGGNVLTFTPAQKGALDGVAKGSTTMRHTALGLLNAAIGTPIILVWEDDNGTTGTSTVKSMEPSTFGDLVVMPNPFDESTTIVCPLPEEAVDVQLMLTDLEGRIVEQRRITGRGAALTERISGADLPNGMYLCSVTADGQVLGITRIVVQH